MFGRFTQKVFALHIGSEGRFLNFCPSAGITGRSRTLFANHGHPVGYIDVGDGVVVAAQQLAAQCCDSVRCGIQLGAALGGFHGQKTAAHLDKGKAQLAEYPQVGHCPGAGEVELLPQGGVQPGLLRSAVDGAHAGEAQLRRNAVQPVQPLGCPAE